MRSPASSTSLVLESLYPLSITLSSHSNTTKSPAVTRTMSAQNDRDFKRDKEAFNVGTVVQRAEDMDEDVESGKEKSLAPGAAVFGGAEGDKEHQNYQRYVSPFPSSIFPLLPSSRLVVLVDPPSFSLAQRWLGLYRNPPDQVDDRCARLLSKAISSLRALS
jgi:hypothetical protein